MPAASAASLYCPSLCCCCSDGVYTCLVCAAHIFIHLAVELEHMANSWLHTLALLNRHPWWMLEITCSGPLQTSSQIAEVPGPSLELVGKTRDQIHAFMLARQALFTAEPSLEPPNLSISCLPSIHFEAGITKSYLWEDSASLSFLRILFLWWDQAINRKASVTIG